MIILASTSPRRHEILGRYTDFKIITEDIEENNEEYTSPEQLVSALSFEKGIRVAQKNEKDIVISADTVVYIDNKVMGKPKDRKDAFNMLKKLSGRRHQVLTGYSIFKIDEKIKYNNYVLSEVVFKNLRDSDINDYLDTKEYVGKAGAYAIQGYGALLVDSIIGDYDNIVGLPISKIFDKLKSLFSISLLKEVDYEKDKREGTEV